ncbi:MAG: beta-propeller domain-containing protein [Euzebya sp.]
MRRLTAILSLLILILSGCTTSRDESVVDASPPPAAGEGSNQPDAGGHSDAVQEARRMLRPFDSCDALLRYFIDGASDLVGPYGLGYGYGGGVRDSANEASAADTAVAQAPATGGNAAPDVSGTNVQEEGVDEPDLVKTDGRIIVTATGQQVQVVDIASQQVVSTVPLEQNAYSGELLLDGTDLLILSTMGAPGTPIASDRIAAFAPTRTLVTRVDLTDPANPVTLGAVRMEGTYRSARMIDGTVRLVMVSDPTGLSFTAPTDGGLSAEQDALDQNRQILASSDIDDWVPHLQIIDADGNAGAVQQILDCTQLNQPAEFAGLQTLSVLTFDLRGDQLAPTSGAGLVAAGDTVYASTDRLIVATSPWGGWIVPFIDVIGPPRTEDLVTDLHSFDISEPAATSYVASGSVQGTLIGQFALSESAGVIRVATTTQPDWFGPSTGEESQSSLIILREEGEELVQTGRLDGLGVTEQIQSVRYLSPDLAAIVTFRQTDPLYLIDTSDPAAPAVLGELEIPGFSSYLHPVGDGYLLGVGQDADEQTGQQLGLQASLFDIRDRANPQRVAQVNFGEGYSPVEYDHRAFLYWSPTGQAVIPAELYPSPDELPVSEGPDGSVEPYFGPTFNGAVVLQVGEGTLTEQGRVANAEVDGPQYVPGVLRSIVIGEDLWTLTQDSLARHSLAGLQRGEVISLV